VAYQKISTTLLSEYFPETVGGVRALSTHGLLTRLIEAELSPQAAAFLAEPAVRDREGRIEWLTQLEGYPKVLSELSGDEREAAVDAVSLRAGELAGLGARLSGGDSGERRLAGKIVTLLASQAAAAASGQGGAARAVAVGGVPVLVGWGLAPVQAGAGQARGAHSLSEKDSDARARNPAGWTPGVPPGLFPASGAGQPPCPPGQGPGFPHGQGPGQAPGFTHGQGPGQGPGYPDGQVRWQGPGQPCGPGSPCGPGQPHGPAAGTAVPHVEVTATAAAAPGAGSWDWLKALLTALFVFLLALFVILLVAPDFRGAAVRAAGDPPELPDAMVEPGLRSELEALRDRYRKTLLACRPDDPPPAAEPEGPPIPEQELVMPPPPPPPPPEPEPAPEPAPEKPAPPPEGSELAIPDDGNLAFLDGCWKSDAGLVSTPGNHSIYYVYCFDGTAGRASVRIEEQLGRGRTATCKTTGRARMDGKSLSIQDQGAKCPGKSGNYSPTRVLCSPGKKGAAACTVQSQSGPKIPTRFTFMGKG
jgi:hypothetical protein